MLYEPIQYQIKRTARSKRIRIVVNANAQVTVMLPMHTPLLLAERFIAEKTPWIRRKIGQFSKRTILPLDTVIAKNPTLRKQKALMCITGYLEHHSKYHGFSFTAVTIKDIKTKWGSCSSKGSLNFNYRIAFLPPHLVEYIVVHELCHLKHLNHSQQFWNLVLYIIPDAKQRRKELNKITFSNND